MHLVPAARRLPVALKLAALATAYFLTARLGLSLGAVSGVATSVWPPTGISLAALLLFGNGLWPGIACAAVLANLSVGVPALAALAIGAGNTLEALGGAYLLRHVVRFRPSLQRVRDVLGLVFLAAALSTMVSATIGVTVAWLGGVVPGSAFGTAWRTWWQGDAMGDLVVAPLLLIWPTHSRLRLSRRKSVEAAALLAGLILLCALVFGGSANINAPYYAEPYLVFPCLIWAALRFDQPGVVIASVVTSGLALWGTAHGFGPFAKETLQGSLLSVQTFMGVVTITALVLGAAISERRTAQAKLRRLAGHVQQQARTLEGILEAVPDHIYLFDASGRVLYVSPPAARARGVERSTIVGKTFAELGLSPTTTSAANRRRSAVFTTGTALSGETRLPTTVGERDFAYTISPIFHEHGRAEAVVVSARDITERKRAEEERTALFALTAEISGTLDFAEILERAQRRTASVLPCNGVATLYWDPRHNVFRIVSHYGIPPEMLAPSAAIEFGPSDPVVQDLAAGRPVLVTEGLTLKWMPAALVQQFQPGGLVAVPLVIRGQLRGALVAANAIGGARFDPQQVQFLESVARHLAVALHGAELYRAQEGEAQVAQALARVSRDLISSFDRPRLVERLCRLTAEVLESHCSHIILWEPSEDAYVAVSGFGHSQQAWETLRAKRFPHALLAPTIASLGRDEVRQFALAASANPVAQELSRELGITVSLGLALRRGNEVIGFLSAASRDREALFTPQQERIAHGLAQLASLALENARLVEELAQANRVKSDFVATMSHELRSPLNVIIGYTDLLLEEAFGALRPEQTESLGRVLRSSCELLELINATLDLSRMDTGHTPVEVTEIRLDDLVAEVHGEMRERPIAPGLTVGWHVSPGLPSLHTDRSKVKVVLKNLVGNALKFTEAGNVNVDVHPCNGGVEVSVGDTGPGIAPEVLPIIFEPFQQGDSSSTRRHGGVGLGLYIVRRLLEVLGGSVNVDSELGRGTTFRVWLPHDFKRGAA